MFLHVVPCEVSERLRWLARTCSGSVLARASFTFAIGVSVVAAPFSAWVARLAPVVCQPSALACLDALWSVAI